MKKFPVEMKNSPFFEGIEETEEEKVLKGLDAHEMTYDKENYILHCGEQVKEMGLLVSGGLLIVQEDFWGNRNLVAKIGPGDVFAETFACMQRRNINVNVIAEETHMGKRNTREKLLSYLSAEAQKHGTSEFDIPFSRQQLADYLSVERSAMSTELGKLRDEGRLSFRKNHFCLNRDVYL